MPQADSKENAAEHSQAAQLTLKGLSEAFTPFPRDDFRAT